MTSIAKCPDCGHEVSISEGLEPQSVVDCPICEKEFPLDEAVAAEAADDDLTLADDEAEADLALEAADKSGDVAESEASPPDQETPPGDEQVDSSDEYKVAGEDDREERAEHEGDGEQEGESYDFGAPAKGDAEAYRAASEALRRNQKPEVPPLSKAGRFIGVVIAGLLGILVAWVFVSVVTWGYSKVAGNSTPDPKPKKSAKASAAPRGVTPNVPEDGEITWPGLEKK